MSKRIFTRMVRSPAFSVSVILFAALLTAVLCVLHSSKLQAQNHYETVYHEIKVPCTITSPTGGISDDLYIMKWQIGLFTGEVGSASRSLAQFVTDVQIKGLEALDGALQEYTLTGITSTVMARQLWLENGCQIRWKEGYDASFFTGGEMGCIIPQKLAEDLKGERLPVSILPKHTGAVAYTGELTVVGTYQGSAEKNIYCPWNTLKQIWRTMGQAETAAALQATLINNDKLETLRTASLEHFTIPDPNAVDAGNLALALDIDDSQLKEADLTLKNSLRVNRLCAFIVFLFATASGFLIGLLMVRSRKKEIALMRTVGVSQMSIYLELAFEQMASVLVGILAGGAYFLWQPQWQILLFGGIYFAGLTAALLIFLRNNLLTTIKEDE